jgi:hypothetical protein
VVEEFYLQSPHSRFALEIRRSRPPVLQNCMAPNRWKPTPGGSSQMKTVLGAIALVMVMSAPALAQRSPYNGYQNPSFYNNQSPASPNYGGNGY